MWHKTKVREQTYDSDLSSSKNSAGIEKGVKGKLVEAQSAMNERGAAEQDGGAGKTTKIILPISFPYHA